MAEPASLERLERWMQAVLTHPEGVGEGERCDEARESLGTTIAEQVEPSAELEAPERIGIYAGMYYARLIEVLEDDFPALKSLLGSERFHATMHAYVAARPSRHYSLNMLGESLPGFLRETSLELEPRDFAVELATLERTVQVVFDAPECGPVGADELAAVPPEAWSGARIEPVPALELLTFEYPTPAWYQAFREERAGPAPEPRPSWLAVYRDADFRIWRAPLEPEQHALLAGLIGGAVLGEALERCAALPGMDAERLAGRVGDWFQEWAGAGLFAAVRVAAG